MFNIYTDILGDKVIHLIDSNKYIPLDPKNSAYQRVLDAIIDEGADCFEGDIPSDLQAVADVKQFAQQLSSYTTATARLAQYVLSVGRAEVVENQATGEQVWNEETMIWKNCVQLERCVI